MGLLSVLFIVINLSLTSAFIIKENKTIEITKGASTFTFELKGVNGSSALLEKIHRQDNTGESATYSTQYNFSDCLIKTERGCHLQLVDVYSSEDTGYAVLKDMDISEEVTLSVSLSFSSTRLDEKDFIFKNVRELESRIRDYTQRFIPCPSKNPTINDIKLKIQESLYHNGRFNDNEINRMITECKVGKEAFIVSLKEKTSIQECLNRIKGKLFEDNVIKYKEFDIIVECVIQEEFKERYAAEVNANMKFFEDLFNKRIFSAANEIKLKEATHERTEDDDEEKYLQILEQKRQHEDPSTFDPNANYTENTFPTYGGETTENFLQRFSNYFKKTFNLKEWFNMLFQKRYKNE